jgi:Mlc titration factor MtfA (ptsG expression regulator)
MFGWLTERRRARLLDEPCPPAWYAIIDDNVALVQRLDAEQRRRLCELVAVFIAEKSWEGCGGLEMTDEIKVTVAAQACMLLIGREHALYKDVESILVYPDTVVAPPRKPSFFEIGAQPIDEHGQAILGQAHLGGPVILAWDDVLAGGRGKGMRNVVFHEFAHKIDMVDGAIDGTPPLPDRAGRKTWAEVCSEVFLRLRDRVDDGKPTFLDEYGATNEAEFFAVATESYFMQPAKLETAHPELFEVLRDFYQFDPR